MLSKQRKTNSAPRKEPKSEAIWNRRILSQGDLDGSCFWYTIVNSFVALTGKMPSERQLDKAIGCLPFSTDFLLYQTGTFRYDGDPRVFTFAIEKAMEILGNGKFRFEATAKPLVKGPGLVTAVLKNLSRRSVVLLEYSGDTVHQTNLLHWLAVVGYNRNPAKLYLECSAIYKAPEKFFEYYEEPDPKFNRLYNDVLTEEVCGPKTEGWPFKITLL
jgi:hypothetical protein